MKKLAEITTKNIKIYDQDVRLSLLPNIPYISGLGSKVRKVPQDQAERKKELRFKTPISSFVLSQYSKLNRI